MNIGRAILEKTCITQWLVKIELMLIFRTQHFDGLMQKRRDSSASLLY